MADDPHFVKPLPEKIDAGERIVLQVLRRAVDHITGGSTKATVVVAERGYALSGQSISNHRKRLMLKDFLIAVLKAAARHHNQNGCLAAISLRKHQRPFQDGVAIGKRHVLLSIRERADWSLRPVQFGFARSKRQWERHPLLREGSHNLPAQIQTIEYRPDGRDLDGQFSYLRKICLGRNPPHPLCWGIHRRTVIPNVEDEGQVRSLNRDYPGPGARLGVCTTKAKCQKVRYSYNPFHINHVYRY